MRNNNKNRIISPTKLTYFVSYPFSQQLPYVFVREGWEVVVVAYARGLDEICELSVADAILVTPLGGR